MATAALFSAVNTSAFAAETSNSSTVSGSEIISIPTESVDQNSQEITNMIAKDMNEHPELVEYAQEVKQPGSTMMTTLSAVPYSFRYNFKNNYSSAHFSSLRFPNLQATVTVNSSKAGSIYLSVYKAGVFKGTRIYANGKTTNGKFPAVGIGGDFNVYLTSDKNGKSYTDLPVASGTATVTAY
ncbi:hypothetical protein ACRPLQ_26290 [Priestia sp. TRN 1309]|uniref:hypothetical protein n=1 Tax=Priestia sp. TRN 1309 TaxID=3420729 RepID=UPI003D7888FE